MSSVVFSTPGHIDIKAFTTFGVNAKPNSENPIGFFGTGLKYAIAVLLREQCKVELWIGETRYTFYRSEFSFRTKDFVGLRMRKEKFSLGQLIGQKSYIELPFTTELGKTWQLWQAFRELESNTRDEGGITELMPDTWSTASIKDSNHTYIVVSGQTFVEEFNAREKTFLSRALVVKDESETLQIFGSPSRHIYYRGMRVLDLERPAVFTYNILERMDLTEDRTLKYAFQAEQAVGRHIAQSKDRSTIGQVVQAKKDYWEHSLRWDYVYYTPDAPFMQVMRSARSPTPSVSGYYSGYVTPEAKISPLDAHPKPWRVVQLGNPPGAEVFDDSDTQMFYAQGDPKVIQAIIDTINKAKEIF